MKKPMTLFRPQRGSLAAAMEECEPCETREQLEAILARKPWPQVLLSVEEYGGIDKRIGWDTYIVMARFADRPDDTTGSPAGFTNGPLP